MNKHIIIGLFLGLIIALPLTFFGYNIIYDNFFILVLIIVVALLSVVLTVSILFFLRRPLTRLLEQRIGEPISLNLDLFRQAITEDDEAGRDNAKAIIFDNFIRFVYWWYSRQALFAVTIGFGTVVAALVGASVLIKQNAIIAQQAKLLCQQNQFLSISNKFSVQSDNQRRRYDVLLTVSRLGSDANQTKVAVEQCATHDTPDKHANCIKEKRRSIDGILNRMVVLLVPYKNELRRELAETARSTLSMKSLYVGLEPKAGQGPLVKNEIVRAANRVTESLNSVGDLLTEIAIKLANGFEARGPELLPRTDCDTYLQKSPRLPSAGS